MNTTMFVKPSNNFIIRDPERGYAPLPKAGANVPRNAYWLRRISDGDVTETTPPKSKTTEAK